MMRPQQALPPIVLILTGAAGSVVWLGVANPWRSVFVLPFLMAVPGLALVPLLRIGGWPGLTLAVGLSLALETVVPTAMIYAGVWSPEATFGVLVLMSLVGAAAQLVTARVAPGVAAEEGP
jgi:hypothetical protein